MRIAESKLIKYDNGYIVISQEESGIIGDLVYTCEHLRSMVGKLTNKHRIAVGNLSYRTHVYKKVLAMPEQIGYKTVEVDLWDDKKTLCYYNPLIKDDIDFILRNGGICYILMEEYFLFQDADDDAPHRFKPKLHQGKVVFMIK